jgi:3-hydroxyacyl-CoA dehydrogenase/enoyl-CoA hydratase/3-hydroxybutyryl-CoA epimerase/enoyl-CoA isomerase
MIYDGTAITVKMIEDGIAELNFNLDGESVNKFNRVTLENLKAATDAIKGNSDVKGVLVTSGKDCFIVGADITEFGEAFKLPEEEIVEWIVEGNKVFNAIEDLPVPTLTAINGIALGGGFEMCLATDFRVMSEKAKVGLPEVKLGLMPGFGGTVRSNGSAWALKIVPTKLYKWVLLTLLLLLKRFVSNLSLCLSLPLLVNLTTKHAAL